MAARGAVGRHAPHDFAGAIVEAIADGDIAVDVVLSDVGVNFDDDGVVLHRVVPVGRVDHAERR